MNNSKLDFELKRDMYVRGRVSAFGHIILVFIFLGISKNYLSHFKEILYFSFICIGLNISRIILCKLYLSNFAKKDYSTLINVVTILGAISWGFIFSLIYLKFGMYQAPSLSLFVIVAGLAAGASSSLYAQKRIIVTFLFFVLIVPGTIIIYNEYHFNEKLLGFLIITYFGFLYSQSNLNRKNLIARIELSEQASEETKRIEQLFNSVPGIFCYFQINGHILSSNQLWRDFSRDFGNQINFYHGLNSQFISLINEFVASNDETISKEYKFLDLSSEPVFICNAQKINSTNGIILFMLDITSLKLIQEEMKLKDAHFQHSARLIELGEVVGAIAHEINNPLTVVLARTQSSKRMIKSNEFDFEKIISNLEVIEISSSRISKLVKGMKSLIRNAENDLPTAQSFEPHLEIVKFIVEEKAETKNIKFEMSVLTNDLSGFCRPSQIEQVLINIINNAIDAAEMTEDRWTKLIISSNSSHLVFEVVDSGRGVGEELLKKIWNPFFTTKDIGKGTGLGLSISYTIIRENNGKFYYKPDCENTTFVIEIPKIKIAA